MLIKFLILFFIILFVYQITIYYFHSKEGLTSSSSDYKTYNINSDNALILSQQNAGNIMNLKEKIDSCNALSSVVQDLSGQIQVLQSQVNNVVSELANSNTAAPDTTT